MTAEMADLHQAIDLIAALDVAALDDDELHRVTIALQRARARLGVVAGRLLGQWDARQVWAGDGSRSATARLSRDTSCSLSSAAVEMRRARQLRGLPATAHAIERGALSLDHIDLLGRANQPHRAARFAQHEAFLVEQCAGLRFAPATHVIDYWCQRADAETERHDDGDAATDGSHLHAAVTIGGAVVVDAVLDPVCGAVVLDELHRLERDIHLVDQRAGITRPPAGRRAAALVAMAQRSAASASTSRPARPLFSVVIGDRSFSDLCELANGTVVSAGQLAPWLDTADLETVLFDGPSTVISVSRRRSVTGALRRAIEVRDRHCRHPAGCDVPADECDVDHIVPYARGGRTSQFNGRLECTTHNRHADRHDHDATPGPSRPISRLDEIRARLRWRLLHEDEEADARPPPIAV
jgi:hypothetical protein